LPSLSIIFCLVLMLALPLETWLRFFVWLAIGLGIYFMFGRKHSVLETAEKAAVLS
jgi:APA family basic amino acid/polyamine antiporter